MHNSTKYEDTITMIIEYKDVKLNETETEVTISYTVDGVAKTKVFDYPISMRKAQRIIEQEETPVVPRPEKTKAEKERQAKSELGIS